METLTNSTMSDSKKWWNELFYEERLYHLKKNGFKFPTGKNISSMFKNRFNPMIK